MSMHKTPLTDLEREGLERHFLAIEYPSQLADVFRQGMAWALSKPQPISQDVLLAKAKRLLIGWAEWYGKNEPKALPPNSKDIVELIEAIDAAMKEGKT